jgi:regulator of replication initiation timing
MQNRQLQKSVSDLENVVLNVDCTNGKLRDENKSLKDRLVKETEKCNGMVCRLQPLETALSQVSQEVVDLTKQLVSLYKFANECFHYLSWTYFAQEYC